DLVQMDICISEWEMEVQAAILKITVRALVRCWAKCCGSTWRPLLDKLQYPWITHSRIAPGHAQKFGRSGSATRGGLRSIGQPVICGSRTWDRTRMRRSIFSHQPAAAARTMGGI